MPVGVVLAAAHACAACTWLDLLTSLSYFKLAISITKYVPQVVLNAKRRSTVGWNIDNVVLDFVGAPRPVQSPREEPRRESAACCE